MMGTRGNGNHPMSRKNRLYWGNLPAEGQQNWSSILSLAIERCLGAMLAGHSVRPCSTPLLLYPLIGRGCENSQNLVLHPSCSREL